MSFLYSTNFVHSITQIIKNIFKKTIILQIAYDGLQSIIAFHRRNRFTQKVVNDGRHCKDESINLNGILDAATYRVITVNQIMLLFLIT